MSGLFDTTNDLAEWENMDDGTQRDEPEADAEPDVTVTVPPGTPTEVTVEAPEETEPETEEPEAEPEPELDPAALQEQIAVLEKRIADKDEFEKRRSDELGELRALQKQMLEHQQRPQVNDWESLIDDDPARAAQIALQAGNQIAYEQAKRAWEEYSPGVPAIYEQGLRHQHRVDQLEQQLEQRTAPIQQQQASAQIAGVYQQVREQYPDFDQHEQAMSELIETRPLLKNTFAEVVQRGSPEEQSAYLIDLYALASGRKADTLREAATKVAREAAAETLRAKQEAQVVSASASIDTDRPKTAADAIGDEWEQMERSRADGWQIRP